MVLVPVTGLGWTVGMFAVSEETVFLQFLFAIFNSSQVDICFKHNLAQKHLYSPPYLYPQTTSLVWKKQKGCDENNRDLLICSV